MALPGMLLSTPTLPAVLLVVLLGLAMGAEPSVAGPAGFKQVPGLPAPASRKFRAGARDRAALAAPAHTSSDSISGSPGPKRRLSPPSSFSYQRSLLQALNPYW